MGPPFPGYFPILRIDFPICGRPDCQPRPDGCNRFLVLFDKIDFLPQTYRVIASGRSQGWKDRTIKPTALILCSITTFSREPRTPPVGIGLPVVVTSPCVYSDLGPDLIDGHYMWDSSLTPAVAVSNGYGPRSNGSWWSCAGKDTGGAEDLASTTTLTKPCGVIGCSDCGCLWWHDDAGLCLVVLNFIQIHTQTGMGRNKKQTNKKRSFKFFRISLSDSCGQFEINHGDIVASHPRVSFSSTSSTLNAYF